MGDSMTLADFATLTTAISGIAVTVSLVFLYFQLRQMNAQAQQNERAQFATIRHTRAARVVDIALAAAEPTWADAVSKGLAGDVDLTGMQFEQLGNYMMARLSNAEDAYYQYREGAFDEAAYSRFSLRMKTMLASLGARVQYKRARHTLGPEFVAFMDRLMSETPVAPNVDALGQWKADIAAERSSDAV